MNMKRWGVAFLQLSAVLLAVGLVPVVLMTIISPSDPGTLPILLSLSVAPLGGVCLVSGLLLWVIGAVRR